MKIKTLLFSTVFILFVTSSCSNDDSELVKEGGPFLISELAGNWEATSAFFGNENDTKNIIEDGGSLSMTVISNGRCTLTIDPDDREGYKVSGEMFWEIYEGEYYFAVKWDAYPDDWATYGATYTEPTFFMNGGFDAGEYDFNNDGTSESARINLEFIRI